MGKSYVVWAYRIGLGVTLDWPQRTPQMMFSLDPVAFVQPPDKSNGKHIKKFGRMLSADFHPVPGRDQPTSTEGVSFEAEWPAEYMWDEFEQFLDRSVDEEAGPDDRAFVERRWIPITPENCAWLFNKDEAWPCFYNMAPFDTWLALRGIKEASVLPPTVTLEGGVWSDAVRDRFEAALYNDGETSLANLLASEVEKRTLAFDDFMLRKMSGDRQRKLGFRRRMRN